MSDDKKPENTVDILSRKLRMERDRAEKAEAALIAIHDVLRGRETDVEHPVVSDAETLYRLTKASEQSNLDLEARVAELERELESRDKMLAAWEAAAQCSAPEPPTAPHGHVAVILPREDASVLCSSLGGGISSTERYWRIHNALILALGGDDE